MPDEENMDEEESVKTIKIEPEELLDSEERLQAIVKRMAKFGDKVFVPIPNVNQKSVKDMKRGHNVNQPGIEEIVYNDLSKYQVFERGKEKIDGNENTKMKSLLQKIEKKEKH